MSVYEDAAPNVSQFVEEGAFLEDFPAPPPPSPPPPIPDAQKKLDLYEAYLVEYTATGGSVALAKLARTMAVPYNWCVILDREVRAAIAALYAVP